MRLRRRSLSLLCRLRHRGAASRPGRPCRNPGAPPAGSAAASDPFPLPPSPVVVLEGRSRRGGRGWAPSLPLPLLVLILMPIPLSRSPPLPRPQRRRASPRRRTLPRRATPKSRRQTSGVARSRARSSFRRGTGGPRRCGSLRRGPCGWSGQPGPRV